MNQATETATVRSSDGTTLAYDRVGTGPAVVLVGAGPTDRKANVPVADLLAESFTVYDRRARDEPPGRRRVQRSRRGSPEEYQLWLHPIVLGAGK